MDCHNLYRVYRSTLIVVQYLIWLSFAIDLYKQNILHGPLYLVTRQRRAVRSILEPQSTLLRFAFHMFLEIPNAALTLPSLCYQHFKTVVLWNISNLKYSDPNFVLRILGVVGFAVSICHSWAIACLQGVLVLLTSILCTHIWCELCLWCTACGIVVGCSYYRHTFNRNAWEMFKDCASLLYG